MSGSFADALAHAQRGDLAAAERILVALTARDPHNADAAHLLANVLHAKGDVSGAVAQFETAQKLSPYDSIIAFNRAAALAGLGRHAEAVASFDHAIKLRPDDGEALLARGASLSALHRYEEALASYDGARAAGVTNNPILFANRGAALAALKRHEEAVACFDRVLAANPNDTQSLFNRGAALFELQRMDEAQRDLDLLLTLQPNHQQGRAIRGVALALQGQYDEGLALIDAAIAAEPQRTDLWARRGFALIVANRGDEALEAYERVLAANPADAAARYAKADTLLSRGDFAEGWDAYEARLQLAKKPLAATAPLWTGAEPLAGASILVQSEQGFGDLFQFCRFIPMLAVQGADVILQERPSTLALMRSLAGVARFARVDETPPLTDFRIPLCSLPRALSIRLDTIPADTPYLHADPERVAQWRDRLGAQTKRRIGVAWAGGADQVLQRARKLDAAALDRLLGAPGIEFVSLQMQDGAEAPIVAKHGARSFGAATADFAELAALIENLDAVVSIDTGVAHLAGALGKPVHIMLPYYADWRWLRDRSDSPWYPSARLYRQPGFAAWAPVIDAVHAALQ